MADREFRLRWTLEDEQGRKIIDEGSSLMILDDDVAAAEAADTAALETCGEAVEKSPELARMVSHNYGKGRVIKEICDATGVIVGKRLRATVRRELGMPE